MRPHTAVAQGAARGRAAAERPFGPVTVAKAYRLLHAIYRGGRQDERPSQSLPDRGRGQEDSEEREIVPLPVVFALAKGARTVPRRGPAGDLRGLRWGELAGLRRESIDLDACEIRVAETVQLDTGGLRLDTKVPGRPANFRIPR